MLVIGDIICQIHVMGYHCAAFDILVVIRPLQPIHRLQLLSIITSNLKICWQRWHMKYRIATTQTQHKLLKFKIQSQDKEPAKW